MAAPPLVVDTSAIVAAIRMEAGFRTLLETLGRAEKRELAAPNFVETAAVLSSGEPGSESALQHLQRFLSDLDIVVAPFDASQALIAAAARLRFGKGHRHPARLNLGDTYAYALAKVRNAPLLFVGEDFAQTDIIPALA